LPPGCATLGAAFSGGTARQRVGARNRGPFVLQVNSSEAPAGLIGRVADRSRAIVTPQAAALATFLLLAGVVLANVLDQTGGTSLYSLDDAYIHLAFAERLRLGHVGINIGEVTSPSSSIIWPLLLVPMAGTPLAHAMPLAFNIVFGGITAWLLGRMAGMAELPAHWNTTAVKRFRIGAGMLLVVACNLVGLAFTGLEHNLQVLIAVALALVLIEHARGTPIPTWALALAALGPAVRYEMFALTATFAVLLLLDRRWRTMAAMCAASLALPALFAAFLLLNGGYPLPNSVMAKLLNPEAMLPQFADSADLPIAERLGRTLSRFLYLSFAARVTVVVSLAVLAWQVRSATRAWRRILACMLAAGLLHLAFGQFGWWYRYEIYIVAFCTTVAALSLAPRHPLPAMLLLLLPASHYLQSIVYTPLATRNIYEQQYQMHRLVTDHYRKPFAANDIGWPGMGFARGYMLDLWGLASNEALARKDKSADWLDDVTRRHGAGMVMIYPQLFKAIPETWTKVGELHMFVKHVTAAHPMVAIYATAAGDRAEIAAALNALRPGLPSGVRVLVKSP